MKANKADRLAQRPPIPGPGVGPCQSPAFSTQERLLRIESLGKRIAGFVQFMCEVPTMTATSAEAKDKAIQAFHDKLVIVEQQLGRIRDEFDLQ